MEKRSNCRYSAWKIIGNIRRKTPVHAHRQLCAEYDDSIATALLVMAQNRELTLLLIINSSRETDVRLMQC